MKDTEPVRAARESAERAAPGDSGGHLRCLDIIRTALVDGSPALSPDRMRDTATSVRRIVARIAAEETTLPALSRQCGVQLASLRSRLETLSGYANPGRDPVQGECRDYAALRDEATRIGSLLRDAQGQSLLQELGRDGGSAAAWFRDAIRTAGEITTAVETAVSRGETPWLQPDVKGPREEVHGSLNEYLRRRFPAWGAEPVRSLSWVPGGRSKWTAMLEMENGAPPGPLVLRMDAPGINYTGKKAADEFAVLQSLHRHGVTVARPVLSEADASVIGGTFIVSEAIVGAHKGGEPFPELIQFKSLSVDFGTQLATSLARQHRMPLEESAHLGTTDGSQTRDRIARYAEIWAGIPTKPPLHLATDLGFAWLLGRDWPADRPTALVHGDLGMHNILIRDGRIAALLDWELMHLGDPAEDIGNCRATLIEPFIGWNRFVDVYLSAGGDAAACDADAALAQSVWAHVRGSFYTAQLWNLAMTVARPDLEYAAIGWDFFARTQDYILRELRVALHQPPGRPNGSDG